MNYNSLIMNNLFKRSFVVLLISDQQRDVNTVQIDTLLAKWDQGCSLQTSHNI